MTDKLKNKLLEKVSNMLDHLEEIGWQDFFDIHLKVVNGEIITKVEFSDKDKIK